MSKRKLKRVRPVSKKQSRLLRRELTPAESKLWSVLRNRQLGGYKFRRQHPIGNYIVDFCCEEVRLVIEIDGDTHVGKEDKDAERTRFLQENGYRVVRFTNEDVHGNMDSVAVRIMEVCDSLRASKK